MHRGRSQAPLGAKASVFVLAGTVAGAAAGAVLGAVGSQVPPPARVALATLSAVAAIVIAALALRGGAPRLPEVDHETPYRWLHSTPLRWAAMNGATLGLGMRSRLGFALWYAIPLGALILGDVVAGAVLYGTYSLVRSLGPLVILRSARSRGLTRATVAVLRRGDTARAVAAGQLLALGVAVMLAVGA